MCMVHGRYNSNDFNKLIMIQSTKAFIADQIERIERMKAQEPLNEINQDIEQHLINQNYGSL